MYMAIQHILFSLLLSRCRALSGEHYLAPQAHAMKMKKFALLKILKEILGLYYSGKDLHRQ